MTCIKNFLTGGLLFLLAFANAGAQETQPMPGTPKTGQIPTVRDKKLANGLVVAVGERRTIPLVTIQLLVNSAAGVEEPEKAGLANLTASLLTKGTKTRTATQIAETIEFLGGSINTNAGWNGSSVTITVSSDKVDQAMAVLADVVMNPTFKTTELDLLRGQELDELKYNLKQPGFLANYVASRYSFDEHPAGGTPESIGKITRADIREFHADQYTPDNAVLIFAGDVTTARANALAARYFGRWKPAHQAELIQSIMSSPLPGPPEKPAKQRKLNRILVIDLPDSGQAAVKYTKSLTSGRTDCDSPGPCKTSQSYYPATVMNSVLGGGYSSRLNQEIRIKRGLSYGAGSGFAWRNWGTNFSTSTQTKSESAAEVAELVLDEVSKLGDKSIAAAELEPRKLVLSGDFGRELETTGGIADRIADLYMFSLRPIELNRYVQDVRSVTEKQVREFADASIGGGDLVIVGDAKLFMDDLRKRFPDMMINTIRADELDLGKESLRK